MIKVLPFESFQKSPLLNFQSEKSIQFVCPNPQLADSVRSSIAGITKTGHCEVVTIAKFISDLIPLAVKENLKRKSDLVGIFATTWKKVFPEPSYEGFLRAYELFSEFRSYTLDFELLAEVREEFHPELFSGLEFFWKVTEQLNLIDEQKAYKLIADIELELQRTSEQIICFHGFDYLSACQIDLLKVLGIRNDVFIAFPSDVLPLTRAGDWIQWIEDLPSEDNNVCDTKLPKREIYTFPKSKLNEYLKKVMGRSERDIYLATKNINFSMVQEVLSGNESFKVSYEMFQNELNIIFKKISDQFKLPLETDKLINSLKNNVERTNFRKTKVQLLLIKRLEEWKEISDANLVLTNFDMKVLKDIVKRDLPRNSIIPYQPEDLPLRVFDIKEVGTAKQLRNGILVVSSKYPSLYGSEKQLPEKVSELLQAIGPIRRREIDFEICKSSILKFLENDQNILIMESGLLESDVGWNKILVGIDFEIKPLSKEENNPTKKLKMVDNTKTYNKQHLSPSSIQTFVECPRKFYFDKIEQASFHYTPKSFVLENLLGTMEHEVIQKFFEEDKSRDVIEISKEIIKKHFSKNSIQVNSFEYEKVINEVIGFSRNGINFLKNLQAVLPGLTFKFEEVVESKISDEINFYGRVDIILNWRDYVGVIDIKRSAAQITNYEDLKQLRKIQLPSYLKRVLSDEKKHLLLGTLCLSDLKASYLFLTEKEIEAELKKSDIKFKTKLVVEDTFNHVFQELTALEENMVNKIFDAHYNFPAIPLSQVVCRYCPVSLFCDRGIDGTE